MPHLHVKPHMGQAFGLALAGEFTVRGPEPRKTHSLGELALATFTQGEVVLTPTVDTYVVAYTPSWAPQVISSVVSLEEGRRAFINAVRLDIIGQGSDATLSVTDYQAGSPPHLDLIDPLVGKESSLSLNTRWQRQLAGEAITLAAQAFFAKAA